MSPPHARNGAALSPHPCKGVHDRRRRDVSLVQGRVNLGTERRDLLKTEVSGFHSWSPFLKWVGLRNPNPEMVSAEDFEQSHLEVAAGDGCFARPVVRECDLFTEICSRRSVATLSDQNRGAVAHKRRRNDRSVSIERGQHRKARSSRCNVNAADVADLCCHRKARVGSQRRRRTESSSACRRCYAIYDDAKSICDTHRRDRYGYHPAPAGSQAARSTRWQARLVLAVGVEVRLAEKLNIYPAARHTGQSTADALPPPYAWSQ